MSEKARKFLLSTSCLICALVLRWFSNSISGGFVADGMTGRVLGLASIGWILFLIAIAVSFAKPKISAVAAILAALSGLPLYLDFAMPLLFRRVFQGGAPAEKWYWYLAGSLSAWIGMITLIAMIVIAARELSRPETHPAVGNTLNS
ncbi:MAG TPA: hypothetical protein VF786_00370 [Terriglobales bacterium]